MTWSNKITALRRVSKHEAPVVAASSFETLALMVRRPASSFETLALLAPQDEAGPRTTLAPQDEGGMDAGARLTMQFEQ